MMKCDPRAYAKCPTHKYCGGCAADAEFVDGSECVLEWLQQPAEEVPE